MSDIFLSYASVDRDRAQQLAEALTRQGYSVWWDRTIPPGRIFDEVIQEAILAAQCMIVLWSVDAVRSNWVKAEAAEGVARGILVPARLGAVVLPIEFKRIQAADLSDWHGEESHREYRQLLLSVQRLMAAPPRAPSVVPSATHEPSGKKTVSRLSPVRTFAFGAVCALVFAGGFMFFPNMGGNEQSGSELPRAQEPRTGDNLQHSPRPADAAAPRPGTRQNLLAPENGGQLLVASADKWELLVDGREDTYTWTDTGFAVFGFKDEKPAVIDTFSVFVPGQSESNMKEFELLVGNTSPTGPFLSIGHFTTANMRTVSAPFQAFHFPPAKARYFKLRSISSHGGQSTAAIAYEVQLFGELQ